MQVKEYPKDTRYKVYSDGRILGPRGKFLKPAVNQGYYYVSIGGKTSKVHRVVCETFLPKKEGLTDVNHINGIKSDNSLSNLEWSNDSHNIGHAFKTGLRTHRGDGNSRALIPSEHIPIIREAIKLGYNPKHIGWYYGVAKETIYSIKYGKNWSHV